jgi:hypothetical protein
MKLYILVWPSKEYGGEYSIYGVFSSKEKAEKSKKLCYVEDGLEIIETTLDEYKEL